MKQYYLVKDNQRVGPLALEQLMANGLTPETLVWTEGMASWTPAGQVQELGALFAPAAPPTPEPPRHQVPEPPQAPAQPVQPQAPAQPSQPVQQPQAPQPQAQQPYGQAQYQQPQYQQWQYQQGQQAPYQPYPAANPADNQKLFKIILYVLLGLTALGGLFSFIGAFSYFGGWFNKPFLGLCQLLSSAATIAISVISIMRMMKNEKYAFLTIAFFALGFILNLLGMIAGGGGVGIFSFVVGLGGLAVAVLASIPQEKATDINSYKALLNEATPLDYALLGVYALFSLITSIMAWSVLRSLKSYL